MQVGVGQLAEFTAGGAVPAAVGGVPVTAGDILGIGQGQPQLSGALRPRKELRMADPLLMDRPGEPLPDFLLSDDVTEKHGLFLVRFLSSTQGPDGPGTKRSKIEVSAGIIRLFVH